MRRPAERSLVFGVLVVAAGGLCTSAFAAVTNEGGYEVTRTQTVLPVPHGMVGRKTIDRETRIGNTADTDGNSLNFSMTLGGFLRRCPMPEGSAPVRFVVRGDFEYSLIVDSVNTDVVPVERKHYEKRMTARITVFVNDDLSVTEGEIAGEFTSNIDGTRTGPIRLQRRFAIGAFGMPDMGAITDAAVVTGDLAAAALMWNASTTILAAQLAWREPNACAELEFEPRTETRSVTSGETVEVRVRYRSRDGQQMIPQGTWDAAVVQGGRVTEPSGQVSSDGTFIVRYVARSSGQPKPGDGMRVEAISPAGYARDVWKIAVPTKYEGTFSQKQQATVGFEALAGYGGASVTQNYRIEGRLVWEPEPGSARTSTFGDVASTFFVATAGAITVSTDPVGSKSVAGRCASNGSKTFDVRSLPPGALQDLTLEVAADGRYRLMLNMESRFLQFEATLRCALVVPPFFYLGGTEIINDAGIELREQAGPVVDDTIAGQAAPIRSGPITITGEWRFRKSQS